MGVSVKDEDKGYKKLLSKVIGKKPFVRVGIFGEAAQAEHGDGLTVLDIATFNEFGLGVPERSFIRAWCDENEDKVTQRLREDTEHALAGDLEWHWIMDRLGLFCQAGIQARISEGIPPPNAPSTIKRKGSSKPLINTGLLRSSVTYAVEEKDASD